MRNYMILNGKNSNEIKGLIIQEFAPITKPQMRTQVETIDGRDGDIVTPLGYASYSKKISIGLYGDFDINEVIAYFATEGEVIFSNEPDKYYKYKIIDQVDYERLIRFRVASVTMHVQPFKYSATEGTLTIDASDTVSGEGSELVLENAAESPFNVFRHKGNATQKTYTGKNLLDVGDNIKSAGQGLTFNYAPDGTINWGGTPTYTWANVTNNFNVNLPAGTYTFSINHTLTHRIYLFYKLADNSTNYWIIEPNTLKSTTTFTQAVVELRLDLSGLVIGQTYNESVKAMIEAGSSATDYEIFVGGKASPNPDYPQDIKVLSGDSKVRIYPSDQKNIADPQDFIDWINLSNKLREKYNWLPNTPQAWSTYGVYDGRPHVVGFDSSLLYTVRESMADPTYNEFAQIYKGIFKENTRYTISFEFMKTVGTAGSTNLRVYYTDGTYSSPVIAGSAADWSRLEHTTIAGKTVAAISLTYASGHTWLDLDTLQIEEAIKASDYTPHISQNYVIPFGDTYLAGIGDYADEPVKVGDTWYIRRAIGKKVLNGSENWQTLASQNTANTFYTATSAIDSTLDRTDAGKAILCDNYTSITNLWGGDDVGVQTFPKQTTGLRLRFRTANSTLSTVDLDGFKSWLSTHPTTVYYVLATPTDEEITDQDLIDALETMYEQVHAYKGRTHVTATAEDGNAPAVLSVEVNENNESTIVNSGNTNSKPVITIYGQGDIAVYLNGIQALQIALGDEDHITIDVEQMEAYKDSLDNLKNRLVTGDYNNLSFKAGENTIYFTGIVTKYEVENYSRWL